MLVDLMKMSTSAAMSTYTTMMRVNSEGRPFAKDLYDLFSALLIQLPLSQHRSLFKTYPSTFTTDEAVEKLGHLEVTNLVYTPNPLDVSNPILTRTTTTFSMSKDMAKALAQHFIHARLFESVTDPQNHRNILKDKRGGSIWTLTPKGKFMIQDFSHRARVPIKHMHDHLNRVQLHFPIVQFERLYDDDQISYTRQTIVDTFKRMMDCISTDTILIDDIGGLNNVNFIEYRDTFYGYQSFEWISEYTSVVSQREAESVASEFLQNGWMAQLIDKSDRESYKREDVVNFKLDRRTQYYMTDKGRLLLQKNSSQNSHLCPNGKTLAAATAIPTVGFTDCVQRPRNQSSTTVNSSNSSIKTANSKTSTNQQQLLTSPPKQHSSSQTPIENLKAEDTAGPGYASRLQSTTNYSLAELKDLIPKASITQYKTVEDGYASKESLTKEINSLPTDSVLQLDSNYDFGFSSISSTSSSMTTSTLRTKPSHIAAEKQFNPEHLEQTGEACTQLKEQLQGLEGTTDVSLRNNNVQPTTSTTLCDYQNNAVFKSHARQNSNSQNSKLQSILEDPLTRMYFRQFLKSCFCEENINFWVDYTSLLKKVQSSFLNSSAASSMSTSSSSSTSTTLYNIIAVDSKILPQSYSYESLLTHCYAIYNNYFCSDTAFNELNIDHGLRYEIALYIQSIFPNSYNDDSYKTMNKELGDNNGSSSDEDINKGIADAAYVPFGSISVSATQQQHHIISSPPMSKNNSSSSHGFRRSNSYHRNRHSNTFQQGILSLKGTTSDTTLLHHHLCNILRLYDHANEHICSMMAEDSLPKFLKTQKYKELISKARKPSSTAAS
ncbi:hypothetical protein BDF20DRAFT_182590 [Mycotypha africana]|uniref:uncharacterized protein n=1 Tax=Mycotypha africana TaxID=64632 RepID=UPI002300956A|nr:uncharacterized protein BDF20DRAFT_182590 [Mycotypha africana]KAI8968445.1 hypothetical protein BDF20DRAFT_182590 [Mycotypha africana]